ncbi:MAG: hypothetical protein LAO03_07985 [Acidobacteriia bacterium]|nr:hypothetical protein [Terriglobia bacterium]
MATSTLAVLATGLALGGDDLKPEQVLARHLDSIGTREAREQVKSRMVEGATIYRFLSGADSFGGSRGIDCKSEFASEGQKSRILLVIKADRYRGEHFMWNGNTVSVVATYRSAFGEFLLSMDAPLREGLLGGVLNTAWPLLDLDGP